MAGKELVKAAVGASIAKITEENYPVLASAETRSEIMEAVAANLTGSQISTFSLDKITVPAGGQPFFTVKSMDDPDGTPEKALFGIVLGHRPNRGYWPKGLDEGGAGSPPDCSSADGKIGVGNPGGDCATCRFAQFKSATKKDGSPGRGQACKQSRLLFLLREGQNFPNVVVVPSSSLKYLDKFLLRLASTGGLFYGIVWKITLKPDKNEDGVEFARMEFERTAKLDPETTQNVKRYAEALAPILNTVSVIETEAIVVGDSD